MLTGTVPNEKKNHVFPCDVLLLWNMFAVEKKEELMLKDPTVRLLIEKQNNPLR